jgi:hypothetical protein
MSHPVIATSITNTYAFCNLLFTYIYVQCKSVYVHISKSDFYTLVVGFITYWIIKAVKNTQRFIVYVNDKITYIRENYQKDENIKKIIKKTMGISKDENFKKIVFIITVCINFIKQKLIELYMKSRCGVKPIPYRKIFVGTMLYQNKLLRFPIKPNAYGTRNILKIEYKVTDDLECPYLSDADGVEYIKSFIETRIDNITITPRLIGFDVIKMTVFDEDFNECIKEYSCNQKIE